MRRATGVFSMLCLLLSAAAFAHTRLSKSTPADGDHLASPSELVLEFSEPVHVTAVAVESDGREQALGEIPEGPAESFAIPVTAQLAPGEYSVTWRAVSADTHIVSGDFIFTVVADAPGSAVDEAVQSSAEPASADERTAAAN